MVENYNEDELAHLRKDIDFLDDEVMKFLVKRFEVTKKIRRYKKANNLPVMDKEREEHVIREKTGSSVLPRKFIKDFYKLIFEESRRIQR